MWLVSTATTFRTVFVLACVSHVWPTYGANILAIETVAGKSHWNFVSAVIGALTNGGHSVTVFTPFPEGDRENYTEVDMSKAMPVKLAIELAALKSMFVSTWQNTSFFMTQGRLLCDRLHDNRRFNEIVARGPSAEFDAILVEPGLWDCVTYLAAESGLPLIFAIPTVSTFFQSERLILGDVSNPAVVSTVVSKHAVLRTLAQRFSNVMELLYQAGVRAFLKQSLKTTDPRPYDSFPSVPPSLVFVNRHFVSDAPKPIPSNVINVGGLHLKPANKIPPDILEFIENSPHGVILFTFGSTVKMASIPNNILQALKKAIAQLPQRVLLKYEGEMKNKPKNVMTRKWFPQRDILEHPNVKLFIGHGGISGIYEAINGGIPVLGFPLFADQYRNIDNLVESGMAISMELFSLSEELFLANILELINDKKYLTNAKIVSNIFKDRPITPEKSVIYWTEYVIRHKGANHLKSQGHNLMWYQYFLLDVLAVMLIVIFIVLFIVYKFTKFIFNYLFKYTCLSMKTKSE